MKFSFPYKPEIFVLPSVKKVSYLIKNNQKNFSSYNFSVDSIPFSMLRDKLRRYLNKTFKVDLNSKPVVGCAHQPGFLFSGIVRKYLFVDSLKGILPVNIIMDNDYGKYVNWKVPLRVNSKYRLKYFYLIKPIFERPLEFVSLPAKQKVSKVVEETGEVLLHLKNKRLTKNFEKFTEILKTNYDLRCNLSYVLNNICFEYIGINHLKSILVSHICKSRGFGSYVKDIIDNIERFSCYYNECLNNYREEYKIRNPKFPFPNLKKKGKIYELPFWYIDSNKQTRRSIYAKRNNGKTLLFYLGLEKNELFYLKNFEIRNIRPKAVTFTMFFRLFVFDLFIHGIGAANYEEITDKVITSYYEINTPPSFFVITETRYLPFSSSGFATGQRGKLMEKLNGNKIKLKRIKQAPHKFLSSGDKLLKRKKSLINQIIKADKLEKQKISNRLKQVDEEILDKLEPKVTKLEKTINQLEKQIQNQKILIRRDYPYFLFSYD